MFKISVLQHACMPVVQGRVALVLCYACYILGSGPWSGRVMVRLMWERNFGYLGHVLNGRCRVCVSVISSLEPELDLAKLGF